jgi:hypothetical protein
MDRREQQHSLTEVMGVPENFFDGQRSDAEGANCVSRVPRSHSGPLQRYSELNSRTGS